MKFREHRGDFESSMQTVVEVQSLTELTDHINKLLAPYVVSFSKDKVKITPYVTLDKRNGWNTYIVTIDGYGVIGFTDGELG
jgi:hypothetical protein